MKKKRVLFGTVVLILTLDLGAVRAQFGNWEGEMEGAPWGFFDQSRYDHDQTHLGLFSLRRSTKLMSSGLFMNRLPFRERERSGFFGRTDWRESLLLGRGLFLSLNNGWGEREKLYSSESFIQAWRDQDPFVIQGDTALDKDAALKLGMEEDAVVGLLGAPLQKLRLAAGEIWKYSAYTLYFEEGRLSRIR